MGLVLSAYGLAARVVDGQDGSREQRQDGRRVVRGRDHDRREEQQHHSGHEDEHRVVAEVPPDRGALVEGHRDSDHARVDDEERPGSQQDGGEGVTLKRAARSDAGVPVQEMDDQQGSSHRQRVLGHVEQDPLETLARHRVLDRGGEPLGDQRRAQSSGQQKRKRERGGKRHGLIATSPGDCHRKELAQHQRGEQKRERERLVADELEADRSREGGDGAGRRQDHEQAVAVDGQVATHGRGAPLSDRGYGSAPARAGARPFKFLPPLLAGARRHHDGDNRCESRRGTVRVELLHGVPPCKSRPPFGREWHPHRQILSRSLDGWTDVRRRAPGFPDG